MKQLLILSGKGGTGKTTIASSFIKLASANVYADYDVDAPNLHLAISQESEPIRTDFYGLPKAEIQLGLCNECGLCKKNCRFDAIQFIDHYYIDMFACEGCGVCEITCPVGAIRLAPHIVGELTLYRNDHIFCTARLKMGSGNSGKLVSEVKKQISTDNENELCIIDGSPGIGCPVIASISGVDLVLIVTEPSVSSISDMERIIKTTESLQTRVCICINKYDTNLKQSDHIENYCKELSIPFVGKVPFDIMANQKVNSGHTLLDEDCLAGNAIKEIFCKTYKLLYS